MTGWLCAALLGISGSLLDRVVVVVDQEVITRSELLGEVRITLAWREGEQAASAEISEALLVTLRDHMIDEILVGNQARRLGFEGVSDDMLAERLWQFKQHFAGNGYRTFLQRFNIEQDAIEDLLRRDLRNETYLMQRLRGRPTADVSAGEDAYKAAVQKWLRDLHQSAEIRLAGEDGVLELQSSD